MNRGEREALELVFPRLSSTNWDPTSDPSELYNCIAWAAEDDKNWWWPDSQDLYYWPPEAPRAETLEAFEMAFATLKYHRDENPSYEEGRDKIAIYAVGNSIKHAARQQPNGLWTSKLGREDDIEHELEGLESDVYGKVILVMSRTNR